MEERNDDPAHEEIGHFGRFEFDLQEADLRTHSFEFGGPTYVIDLQYRLIYWNTAFEELIATPMRLPRYQARNELQHPRFPADRPDAHCSEMQLHQVVDDRVTLDLPGTGCVEFHRIITQIIDDDGGVIAWSAHLLIVDPVHSSQLWPRVIQRLEQNTTWSKYATVYDSLLLNFTDYVALQAKVAEQMAGTTRCVDLGAGTGNSSLALLNSDSTRSVCAVDSNEHMLNRLRHKAGHKYRQRLSVYKCDITSMPMFTDGAFDGAILVNTLYALDDPAVCLNEIHRILSEDGVLTLTTPHDQTDVDRLFAQLRRDLTRKGLFASQEHAFHAARERHAAMDSMIHRFTIKQLQTMISDCGFIVESMESEYVDAVVLIKARKK